jgi:hypothetical protein
LVQRVEFAFYAARAYPRTDGGDKRHGRDNPPLHNRTILPFFCLKPEGFTMRPSPYDPANQDNPDL